mmetsp:Transcript_31014/g.48604  ORF Transcript_31014/g.48604 Transcript_31014/m.48604 type:complete len:302 (-) Transcript_31014:278-1183(-)
MNIFILCYRLGILSDFTLYGEGEESLLEDEELTAWLLTWYFTCSFMLTLFMMNVVIGVLGESYDVEQDRAVSSFLRERGSIVFKYSMRIFKVEFPLPLYHQVLSKVFTLYQESKPEGLFWIVLSAPVILLYCLGRSFVAEWHVYDYQGDYEGKDCEAPYLWFCVRKRQDGSEDAEQLSTCRIQMLKEHTDRKMRDLQTFIGEEVARSQARVEAAIHRLERLHTGSGNNSPSHPNAQYTGDSARRRQNTGRTSIKDGVASHVQDPPNRKRSDMKSGREGRAVSAHAVVQSCDLRCPFSGLAL